MSSPEQSQNEQALWQVYALKNAIEHRLQVAFRPDERARLIAEWEDCDYEIKRLEAAPIKPLPPAKPSRKSRSIPIFIPIGAIALIILLIVLFILLSGVLK